MAKGTAKSSNFDPQARGRQKEHTGNGRNLLRPQSPPPGTHLIQQGHTSESFPNSTTNLGLRIQMYVPMMAIFIQINIFHSLTSIGS